MLEPRSTSPVCNLAARPRRAVTETTFEGTLIPDTSFETLRSEDSLAKRVDAFGAEKPTYSGCDPLRFAARCHWLCQGCGSGRRIRLICDVLPPDDAMFPRDLTFRRVSRKNYPTRPPRIRLSFPCRWQILSHSQWCRFWTAAPAAIVDPSRLSSRSPI
jgi:hypothetical protein